MPDYELVLAHLEAALEEVKLKTRQIEFEWITPPPTVPTASKYPASSLKQKTKKFFNKSILTPAETFDSKTTTPETYLKSKSKLSKLFRLKKKK